MKKIVMIFTGGTISMDTNDDGLVVPTNSGEDLLKLVGSINEKAKLEIIDFCKIPSPSMDLKIMLELGKKIQSELDKKSVDAVVVTHGTDTLEETAYFLELYLNCHKPVVMTGSMRNSSDLGFDGPSNINCAVNVALSDNSINRGVLLALNDEINYAKEVTKTHTFKVDTFQSLEFGPLGIVDGDKAIYYRNVLEKQVNIPINTLSKKVALIKCYAGMHSSIIDHFIDRNFDGIVIEAFGRGNVPPSIVPAIKKAIEKGIIIVMVSRCIEGTVLDSYGYEGGGKHLKSIGVLFGGYLNGPKARIKLQFALEYYKDKQKIKEFLS